MAFSDDFSFDACMRSVEFDIEFLHTNPLTLLGEYTLRAQQDALFNKTMITALMAYINEHGIKWNDKF